MAISANNSRGGEKKLNYFQKLWQYRKYLVIEPFFFFYYMASVFNAVAMQNFPLDKACRVDLKYGKNVCDTMLDKSELDIDCDGYSFENTTLGADISAPLVTFSSPDFNFTVCKAELEAQQLTSEISGIRAPIAAIFPLIVLLFAGGWADRYNKRKPCMILPIMGEALGFACLLISAIFFDWLPMAFGAYCEAIVPAIFGGLTFCMMAVYSYMTISTPEEDRLFRFGIFAMFITAVPFIGQPISGYLFQKFGYIISFSMALSFQIIAILYIIFFLDEVKPEPKSTNDELQGADNNAYDDVHGSKNGRNMEMTPTKSTIDNNNTTSPESSGIRKFLREFFDPQLIRDCVRFPLIKRKNNGRLLLILLILAYFLTLGPAAAENDYWYRYTLKKLKWNGNDFSIYLTLSSASALVGTFIGTALLSKLLKFSDSTIGILSATAIVFSRIVFAFAKDSQTFYIGVIIETFVTLRVIAIKAIGSSIVDGEELSKMYSIFGISEPIGQFIFPPIFSAIYIATVENFPGAIFLFGEIFYVPNIIVFILCYFILRRNKRNTARKEALEAANAAANNGPPTTSAMARAVTATNGARNANGGGGYINPDSEVTSL